MAEVNDVFKEVTAERSYYDPSKKKSSGRKGDFKPYREGDYLGHITDVESIIVDVKRDGNYRARLYTYTITVAPENTKMQYMYKDINGDKKVHDGSAYVGKNIKGKLWRFLEPQAEDTFESHSGGNKNYMRFCEVMGVETPTEKKEIDGKEVELKMLPNLTTEDMMNKPVCAFVAKGRTYKNKEGKTRWFYDAKFCKKWEDGKMLEGGGASEDEIPF
tara:strand:+ start:520 stop:1170 length:651 start_codon:yes stop_codon:yes gene_type:complete